MHVGIQAPFLLPYVTPAFIADAARAAEDAGFQTIWAPEHVVLFDDYDSTYPYTPNGKLRGPGNSPILEPFDYLTFIAAATKRIRIGTAICLLAQRNPVYTAKQAATIDYLSGGRFDLGVGIGWLAEEFAAVQVPFETRAQRTRSYVAVMRSLWCDWSFPGLADTPCKGRRTLKVSVNHVFIEEAGAAGEEVSAAVVETATS